MRYPDPTRRWELSITVWLVVSLLWPVAAQEPSRRAESAREMLEVMQIDSSQLKHFTDDRPVLDEEREPLEKILFRLPMFAQADVDRWSQPISEPDAMIANPDSYRFDMYDLQGQVTGLRELTVIPEMAQRLGFRSFFEVQLSSEGVTAIVYVRSIPRRWQDSGEAQRGIGQTVRVQALMLKRLNKPPQPAIAFAAARANWHPDQPSELLGVSHDQVLLSQLGVDVDRLTDVQHKSPVVGEDRECFYQMLAAVRLAEPLTLAKLGRREFDIARLIRTPRDASGELYTLRGLARRAIKIHVEDADIRERFGIDHYFEVEVFMPLTKQVRFIDPQNVDEVGKVFTEYPFVICVPELPSGMDQGDDIRVQVGFSGFFMKLWAYRTQFMSGDQPRMAAPRLQQSPLLIGPTITPVQPGTPQESYLSLVIACLFTSCLLLAWFALWRTSVDDGRHAKHLFRKHEPTDDFEGLQDL